MKTKADKIEEILTRGVSNIFPDKKTLAKKMASKKIKLYLGIDPTGNFLHLGHSVVLRKLQQFAELGHEVILLIGNGTVKIGDPTGRDNSRPMLTDEEIEENFKNWKKQAKKILDFDLIKIKHNGDWLDKLTMPKIIKLMAKVTVQQLLERDMFQERMKNELPIFGHEIMYPILQGYDSVAMNVDLEIGGNDQTFNMMMGRTLQKIYNQKEKWVLTTPLILGTDGRKMSKSYNNFVALTDKPKDIYGKLMSLADDLIVEYFTILTDVPMSDIKSMEKAMQDGQNPMDFKKKLAFTITKQLHDASKAQKAQNYFEKVFQARKMPEDMPVVEIKKNEIELQRLVKACVPKESNSQIRRLIKQKAIGFMQKDGSVEKITDPEAQVNITDEKIIKIGKKRFFKIKK